MPGANRETGFIRQVDQNTNISVATARIHALLTPMEAKLLAEMVDKSRKDFGANEVDKDSLKARLELAAEGRDAPSTGHPDFYL